MKCLRRGLSDIYRGQWLWDLSIADRENGSVQRRHVDHVRCAPGRRMGQNRHSERGHGVPHDKNGCVQAERMESVGHRDR